MYPASPQLNLTGALGIPTNVEPVEEVVAVPERETVFQVTTAPVRLEAVKASLITATREKVGLDHLETLGKEPPSCVTVETRGENHEVEQQKTAYIQRPRTRHR